MLKRYSVLMAVLVFGLMVISACAPAAAPAVEEVPSETSSLPRCRNGTRRRSRKALR